MSNLGIIFALSGAVLSALVAGLGSAKAVGMCGEAAAVSAPMILLNSVRC